MSLDKIQLSSFLLRGLYSKSLIDSDIQQMNNESVENNIRYLGMNKKNILVIVDDKGNLFLSNNQFDFLVEILMACKLSLNDVILINIDKNPETNYTVLIKKFIPEKIILFGVEPQRLNFPLLFPHYQLQKYNHQTYLSAPSLENLRTQKNQKVQLWNSLKKLFLSQ